jgi:heat shock protein HtpX
MAVNYAKTAMLLLLLTVIFVAFGAAIGGRTGIWVAFVMALAMNLFSLWNADTLVLRMHRAEEVDERSAPELYRLVARLAERAELPMPRVYVMNNPQPNAFATGRSPSRAAVCASTGLLDMLSPEELAGVLAHELAHIRNRDTLTMAVAATIGGAISMVAQYMQFSMIFGGGRDPNRSGLGWVGTLVAIIVAPMAAGMVQMAISRSREYQADRVGSAICGNPLWLASALEKIQERVRVVRNRTAEAIPATAHLFIVNPLTGRGMDNWFSTHPSTENRIAALLELAKELGAGAGTQPGGAWGSTGQIASGATGRPRGPWG